MKKAPNGPPNSYSRLCLELIFVWVSDTINNASFSSFTSVLVTDLVTRPGVNTRSSTFISGVRAAFGGRPLRLGVDVVDCCSIGFFVAGVAGFRLFRGDLGGDLLRPRAFLPGDRERDLGRPTERAGEADRERRRK